MRGTLRKKLLKSGKYSLFIDYFPPVWNPGKQIYTRREFLGLYLYKDAVTSLEKRENKLYCVVRRLTIKNQGLPVESRIYVNTSFKQNYKNRGNLGK
ncbi:hypothetical protein LL912_20845 [Niabella sp. CC-SYL272]|nr:hypothetical protein [Niabella agricola]